MSDTIVMSADINFEGQHLTHFRLATWDEVCDATMKSRSKSWEVDLLPNSLLKTVVECLLPLITVALIKSQAESDVLVYFKTTDVRPWIKKQYLDREVPNNYRPVSNLAFLSNILEKVVATCLVSHLITHNLHDNLQPTYHGHLAPEGPS